MRKVYSSFVITSVLTILAVVGIQAADTAQNLNNTVVTDGVVAKGQEKLERVDIGQGVVVVKTPVGNGSYLLEAESEGGKRSLTEAELTRFYQKELAKEQAKSDKIKSKNKQTGSTEELVKKNHLRSILVDNKDGIEPAEKYLSDAMSNMFRQHLDLKIVDVYEYKDGHRQKPGDIERIIRTVDINSGKKLSDQDNIVLFSATGVTIQHYVEATKGARLELYLFAYDKVAEKYQIVPDVSEQIKKLGVTGLSDLSNKIMSKGVKEVISPDTRLYQVVDMLYKNLK